MVVEKQDVLLFYFIFFFANIQFKFHVKKIEFTIERNENIIIFEKFFRIAKINEIFQL